MIFSGHNRCDPWRSTEVHKRSLPGNPGHSRAHRCRGLYHGDVHLPLDRFLGLSLGFSHTSPHHFNLWISWSSRGSGNLTQSNQSCGKFEKKIEILMFCIRIPPYCWLLLTPLVLIFNGNKFPSFLVLVHEVQERASRHATRQWIWQQTQVLHISSDFTSPGCPEQVCAYLLPEICCCLQPSSAKDDMCATLVLRNNEWADLRKRSVLYQSSEHWDYMTSFLANFAICGGCSRVLRCIV